MTGADILERLANLPRSQRALVLGLLLASFVGLFIYFGFMPQSAELDRLETDQKDLVERRDQVKTRAENRDRFEAELDELTEQLKFALRELPDSREIPELLKRVSSVGKKKGLEMRKFQPLPEIKEQYYAEVPFAVELSGSYHEVATFFDGLSKLSRIVSVRDVTMNTPNDRAGKIVLQVACTVVTYRFLTEEELKARQSVSEEGRGGRRRNK